MYVMSKRRKYSEEFKLEVVQLTKEKKIMAGKGKERTTAQQPPNVAYGSVAEVATVLQQ